MNLLPGLDGATRRSELAVFISLGFAGVLMVALAAVQMTRFVADSDRMGAAPTDNSRIVSNNVCGPVNARAAPRERASGRLRSGGDPGLGRLLR